MKLLTAGLIDRRFVATVLLLYAFLDAMPARAMDRVTLKRDGKTLEIEGRLVIDAQDGGLLLMARDGVLWAVPPEELVAHATDHRPFEPYSREELGKRLLDELPKGFRVYQTAHYLICYDTSPIYAQWCGSLFERLYMAFTNHWRRKGFEIAEPEFPLVAIVFADKHSYLTFSRADLGEAGESVLGYYSMVSNRMTMYDLTGIAAQGRNGTRGRTAAQINQILTQPTALQTVATIVHEATHQIAFNGGLHQRLSDCPLWFSEGIAEYFETPDLRSAKGWSGIGAVNDARLRQFLNYLPRRPANALESLIADDSPFRDTKRALDAYAEAWALTYFLIKQRPKEYLAYLAILSKKKPLMQDDAETRLNDFRRAFGELGPLEAEFLRYIARLR